MERKHDLISAGKIALGCISAVGLAAGSWVVVPAVGEVARGRTESGAGAAGYELTWYTVDGGGVMFATSSDGRYEVSGTIGQPDASEPMTGPPDSGYEVTGGFWFALAPGDCNGDAGVNLFDHRDFSACMAGPADGPLNLECRCFDVDGNGTVDLADFAQIAAGFTGG